MPGFDVNRFIDLSDSLAKNLTCSICLSIFDTAVISSCGHTFCKCCIESWITDKNEKCPECRMPFKKADRFKSYRNQCTEIIRQYEFIRDFKTNTIISELKTRCDFQQNGCEMVFEFGHLSAHLQECDHRLCKCCELVINDTDDHNCIEQLKSEMNKFKNKLETLENMKKLKEEGAEAKEEHNFLSSLSMQMANQQLHTVYILFGTFYTAKYHVDLKDDCIRFVPRRIQAPTSEFAITFLAIDEILCSSDPSSKVVLIRLKNLHSYVRNSLDLGHSSENGWFDKDSYDESENYIKIYFSSKIELTFFQLALQIYFHNNKMQLNSMEIDENRIREMLTKAVKDCGWLIRKLVENI